MKELSLITRYFPDLSEKQQQQFAELATLYREWNAKINVISRKTIDRLYSLHVLPSLAFARVLEFEPGTEVIDVGTGGGFPGIPLAVMMPEVHFELIDSVGKKVKVVQEIASALGLNNVQVQQVYSKEHKEKYDFVTGRAVKPFNEFYKLTRHLVDHEDKNALPNGLLYLTGGDIQAELRRFKGYYIHPLTTYFDKSDAGDKKIIYYPV